MLLDLFDRPRPLELGPVWYDARALRLGDAAELESLAITGRPDPLALLAPPDADPEARDAGLRAAWAACKARPDFGTPEMERFLASEPIATALAVKAVLRGHRLTLEQAAGVAVAARPEQWRGFRAVAWGDDPAEAIVRLTDERLGFAPPPTHRGRTVTWLEVAAMLCERWPPRVVERVTIPAARILMRGGAERHPEALGLDGWHAFRLANERNGPRRRFWRGEDPFPGRDSAGADAVSLDPPDPGVELAGDPDAGDPPILGHNLDGGS
jgi:hypothetical protein